MSSNKRDVANLLSFRYECLTSLSFDISSCVPTIPQHILDNLESFVINRRTNVAGNEKEILLNLTNAPFLSSLKAPTSICIFLSKLTKQHSFDRLTKLSIGSFDGNEALKHVADAASKGYFPNLQKLVVNIGQYDPEISNPIMPFVPIIMARRKTLKLLDVTDCPPIRYEEIKMLEKMPLLSDFELKVAIRSNFHEKYHASWLSEADHLSSFELFDADIRKIECLGRLPKLQKATFDDCRVQRRDLDALFKRPGQLKFLEFTECDVLSEDADGNTVIDKYNFTWNALTGEYD